MKYKGVVKIGPASYKAQITVDGQTKYLGCFPTPEDAHEAYNKARVDRDSKDLPTGITKTSSGKFRVRVRVNNKVQSIGSFDTQQEAEAAIIAQQTYRYPSYEDRPTHIRVAVLPNLEKHVDYYPDIGQFFWHNTQSCASSVKDGYIVILYGNYNLGQYYDAYEVAWTAMKGRPPWRSLRVKYLNHNPRDLRWENLVFHE